ncbi:hypothetical protein [Streptomyces sp. NPDC094472]|uniref:hypothetical protein n=1 Tax=unclassified Streptomyces TaxID=2593676 RepID=UPI003322FD48
MKRRMLMSDGVAITRSTGHAGKAVTTAALAGVLLATTGALAPAVAQDGRSAPRPTADGNGAEAGVSDISATCRNNGRNYAVRQYFRGPARYTLRCGTSTWGWKHIKQRWSRSFDNKISNAIATGRQTVSTFSTWTLAPCSRETFRVKVGTPAGINDVRTAYKVDPAVAVMC